MTSTKKKHVLIVEDSDPVRETLITQLSNEGYDVTDAANGNDAIPLLHGHAFDLIVLDLGMPYIDGFGVLKFVKSTFPRTKVVILTAYKDAESLRRCKELGADAIINKPYDHERLVEMLNNLFTE